eukprot:gnl/Hemi2/14834_TR5032_c0_g1_i1.p1 gnl/Hemi2/14834_TR5032_c0_g1~~gnl/Hemi2/14834_TR5032_c0_g1_i1.p1  ORF type:complete len:238 (+),score=11.15 gnl/Hemi2/14834_TR5032_c0_g1_i1:40-753(+)
MSTSSDSKEESSLRVPCPECSKTFLDKKNLYAHRRNFHDARAKACDDCGRKYLTTENFARHKVSGKCTSKKKQTTQQSPAQAESVSEPPAVSAEPPSIPQAQTDDSDEDDGIEVPPLVRLDPPSLQLFMRSRSRAPLEFAEVTEVNGDGAYLRLAKSGQLGLMPRKEFHQWMRDNDCGCRIVGYRTQVGITGGIVGKSGLLRVAMIVGGTHICDACFERAKAGLPPDCPLKKTGVCK